MQHNNSVLCLTKEKKQKAKKNFMDHYHFLHGPINLFWDNKHIQKML